MHAGGQRRDSVGYGAGGVGLGLGLGSTDVAIISALGDVNGRSLPFPDTPTDAKGVLLSVAHFPGLQWDIPLLELFRVVGWETGIQIGILFIYFGPGRLIYLAWRRSRNLKENA